MKKELITFRNPKSPISEVFRTLRTNIQFMNVNKRLKCILVTSSNPREGKSWVASNLAITFAQANKNVILIDADMRKGRQYSIFGVSPRPGLANYLSEYTENEEEEKINRYIQETEMEGLDVMAAGNVPPNPSELLITPQMNSLLQKLSNKYDIIIIDAPPCELVTDATIISRLVDTTIVVAAHKQTKKAVLQKTIKSIKNVGGNIAGVVLNKVPIDAKKYEKSYYYGSQLVTTTRKNEKINFKARSEDYYNNEQEISTEIKSEREIKKSPKAQEMNAEDTEKIFKQVNEYLEQEKKKLEEIKRRN